MVQSTGLKWKRVLYAPTLTGSLLSVKKLTSKGNTVEFTDNQGFIRKNEKLLAVGKLENSLYKLLCQHKTEMANVAKSEINHQNCTHVAKTVRASRSECCKEDW